MAMRGKPLAMLIVGKHHPPAGGPPSTDAGPVDAGPGKSALDVATDLIAGVQAKDPNAVAAALQAYCDLHESGEPEGGEPDGDEGAPPAQ
jgi:hypothetical protein